VSSPQISQIENSTLKPKFGDLLQPTSQKLGRTTLHATVSLAKPRRRGRNVLLRGRIDPTTVGHSAVVQVNAAPAGSSHALRRVKQFSLRPGTRSFRLRVALRPGRAWRVQVRYADPGVIVAGASKHRFAIG
jgi:hypothetical protein